VASLVLTHTIVIRDTINQGVMQGNATPTRRNFFLRSAPQSAIWMILFPNGGDPTPQARRNDLPVSAGKPGEALSLSHYVVRCSAPEGSVAVRDQALARRRGGAQLVRMSCDVLWTRLLGSMAAHVGTICHPCQFRGHRPSLDAEFWSPQRLAISRSDA
jgi:hypothetical protein